MHLIFAGLGLLLIYFLDREAPGRAAPAIIAIALACVFPPLWLALLGALGVYGLFMIFKDAITAKRKNRIETAGQTAGLNREQTKKITETTA